MKTLVIPVMAKVELTPAIIRDALGPKTMAAAKKALAEETRADLARVARQSSVAAYSDAVRTVVKAITRYEAAKGTRDERHALTHLEAACVGLRAAHRTLKKMVEAVEPAETTEPNKED